RINSSTRNTRIERMWVEVGTQFARRWRAFFTRLERRHGLDPTKPEHLWLLHYLFLGMINDDCDSFRDQWNHHPISGLGKDQSPLDMRLLCQMKYGTHARPDDFDDVHPSILSEYYGVDREERILRRDQSGAGHSDDEGEDGEDDPSNHVSGDGSSSHLDAAIAAAQGPHIRHDPIPVPDTRCPFTDEISDLFQKSLNDVRTAGIVPNFHGVREDEWPEGGYGTHEFLAVGRGGRKLSVELPFVLWYPRAVAWAQGLDLMNRIIGV
ncbi:hypothetical protein C8Q78DRAFT_980518, partial [Trametes maxima]